MKTLTLTQRVAAMLILALTGLLAARDCFSQARLVKDINTAEYRHFNEYSQLTNAHGLFYFVNLRKELWKSDGNTQGTVRVKTLHGIENLTLIGNTLYFAGKDQNGLELWKSDGTPEGTVIVKDIRAGISGSAPKQFTSLNGTIFFVANDGRGDELWKTDGTSTGTVLVKDIRKGIAGSKPSYLTAMTDELYFSANDGKHGRELWRSDGTTAGTVIVKDIEARNGRSSEPQELVTLNGLLYFSAMQSVSGRELWKSDGTANGTVQLKDINPGTGSSGITSIRRMSNNIYFNANNGSTGTALWRSSGAIEGTVMVKDLTSGNAEFRIDDMTLLNNHIYWVVEVDLFHEYEVWVSDGTAAGTRLATTFETQYTSARFTPMNNKIYYFSGYWDDDVYGPFQQVCSINPDGSGWLEIWNMETPHSLEENDEYDLSLDLLAFENALIFPGVRNPMEGYKLLKSNGTDAEPPILIDTYQPTRSSFPNSMMKSSSGIYFLAQNNAWDDAQLWKTDGTNKGTVLIKSSPGVSAAVNVNNVAYFVTWGNDVGSQLWKTDGTPGSTTSLKVLDHYPQLLDVGGTLFFYNDAGEVWKSDGTSAGTTLLKTFPSVEHVAASGSIAYILVRSASGGQELWKSNGTSPGTVKVKTIREFEGPFTSNHATSTTLGNIFYFVGHDGRHGHELWRTDGSEAGTFMVNDNLTKDNHQRMDIWRVTTLSNAIYFNAMDTNDELSLFRSDGTNAGTHEIFDSDRIIEFMPYNDRLLFISLGPASQRLYATDGTKAGTTLLKELPPNYGWWISHTQMSGILYFSFSGSDLMWRTDGTECGTFGINVGLRKVDNPIPADNNLLLFSGHRDDYGEELFSINVKHLPLPSCPEAFAASEETSTELSNKGETENITYTPNPFNSDFTVVVNSDSHSTAEVVVQDMAGHRVISQILDTNKTYRFGSNWRDGIYVMRIHVDGKVRHKRIIKSSQ